MNFKYLHNRLEQMVWLPPNWDGFESQPIIPKVYEVGKQFLNLLENNPNVSVIKLLVGVDIVGTLELAVYTDNKVFEMTILTNGAVLYEEHMGNICTGSGSFHLSKLVLEAILG